MRKGRINLIIFAFIIIIGRLDADLSKDYLVLSGDEELIQYGMDTTRHWWAVTSPFTNQYKIYIDGESSDVYNNISSLTFAPNGDKWAYFALDNAQLWLVTESEILKLPGTKGGRIVYSSNSESMAYSYFYGNEEIIISGKMEIRAYQRIGNFYLNNNGNNIAFIAKRSGKSVININEKESGMYDSVIVFGFWHNNHLLYAAGNEWHWQVYLGNKAIGSVYNRISNPVINAAGDVAAFIGSTVGDKSVAVLISDDYYEPLESKFYEQVSALTLHPFLPSYAFYSSDGIKKMAVYNSSEYYGGRETGGIFFTHDGSELNYSYCEIGCYFVINGRKYPLANDVALRSKIAMKPQSLTFAYSTSTSLVMSYIERNFLVSGMMTDETIPPRYNRFDDQYETLGRINNRLYLLTIKI